MFNSQPMFGASSMLMRRDSYEDKKSSINHRSCTNKPMITGEMENNTCNMPTSGEQSKKWLKLCFINFDILSVLYLLRYLCCVIFVLNKNIANLTYLCKLIRLYAYWISVKNNLFVYFIYFSSYVVFVIRVKITY